MVGIRTGAIPTAGAPKVLFKGRYYTAAGRHYDISSNGQKFLMIKDVEQTKEVSAPTQLIPIDSSSGVNISPVSP